MKDRGKQRRREALHFADAMLRRYELPQARRLELARICADLGIEPPMVERVFATEVERAEHVLALNLMRRHLGPISWANGFKRLLDVRGVERKPGPKAENGAEAISASVALIAEEVGVPRRTAFRRLQIEELRNRAHGRGGGKRTTQG